MRNIINAFFIITLLFFFIGCSSEDDKDKVEIVSLSIASQTVTITSPLDLKETEWIAVTESNNSYALPLNWIEGFEYEAGFEYKLKVKKITPINSIQDAPQSFYYLIEILSKNKVE